MRRNTLNVKRAPPNDENYAGTLIEKSMFKKLSRHRSRSQVVPEGQFLEDLNEAFVKSGAFPRAPVQWANCLAGLEPIRSLHRPVVLKERTAAAANAQPMLADHSAEGRYTVDAEARRNNVASLISMFNSNLGSNRP